MTEKRDESRLPPIWVPLYEDELATCDDCERETVHGCFIREADAKLEDIDVAKYVPASALESVTRERDAAVMRVGELTDGIREICRNLPHDSRLMDRVEALLTPKEPSDAVR